MGAKNRRPGRLEGRKKSLRRERGRLSDPTRDEVPGPDQRKNKRPSGTITESRRRARLSRRGEAHELVRKMPPEGLADEARP